MTFLYDVTRHQHGSGCVYFYSRHFLTSYKTLIIKILEQNNTSFLFTFYCVESYCPWSVCPSDRPFLLSISTMSKTEYLQSLGDVKRSIWRHDHNLKKYLSLKSFSNYLQDYLTNCCNDLQIGLLSEFKNYIKIWVNYWN